MDFFPLDSWKLFDTFAFEAYEKLILFNVTSNAHPMWHCENPKWICIYSEKRKKQEQTSRAFAFQIRFSRKKWIIAETIISVLAFKNLFVFIIVLEGVEMPSPYWLSLRRIIKDKKFNYKWVIAYFSEFHEIFASFLWKSTILFCLRKSSVAKSIHLNRKSNKKCREKREFWWALRIWL